MKNLKIKRKDGVVICVTLYPDGASNYIRIDYDSYEDYFDIQRMELRTKSECIKLGEWLLKNADKLETTKEKK